VVAIHPSEYLNYTVNVTASGTYSMDANVCCGGPGGAFRVVIDGADVSGTLTIPKGTSYKNLTVGGIKLTRGQHLMSVSFDYMGKQADMGTDGNITDVKFVVAASGGRDPKLLALFLSTIFFALSALMAWRHYVERGERLRWTGKPYQTLRAICFLGSGGLARPRTGICKG
jgi:hypothetical protein